MNSSQCKNSTPVYNIVSEPVALEVTFLTHIEDPQKWLDHIFTDPIVSILQKNTHLTKKQLESLLLDNAAALSPLPKLSYEAKAKFRPVPVSRGAFNRTLHQARRNIISSVYTMLLLAYLGLLEGSLFDQYRNLGEELRHYRSVLSDDRPTDPASLQALTRLQRTLNDSIILLTQPKILKPIT